MKRLYFLAELTAKIQDYRPFYTEGLRILDKSDAKALGDLLFYAYRGTVDDQGETIDDALIEAKNTLDGFYGLVIWPASFVIERNGELLAGLVVTAWPRENDYLLAFSVTRPEYREQGFATELIRLSQKELFRMEGRKLALFVNERNYKAISIYRKCGFYPATFEKSI